MKIILMCFTILLILPFVICISGCQGVPVEPKLSYKKCPFEADSLDEIEVHSTLPWQDTGLILEVGDEMFFEAEGKWSVWTGEKQWLSSPEGRIGVYSVYVPLLPEEPWGALLGRVGGESPFKIGVQGYKRVTSPGPLYFVINDCAGCYLDNSGSIKVKIYHKKIRQTQSQATAWSEPTAQLSQVSAKVNSNNDLDKVGNCYAVVIGLSNYKYTQSGDLTDLAYADADAIVFKKALIKSGWNSDYIKLLTNKQATQRNILIALESWLKKARPEDMVVLFWSGHGFPDPQDPQQVYFACYDTDPRIPATGYRVDQVYRALEEVQSRNVVVLADACHSGKLSMKSNNRAISLVPAKKSIPKGWIFMFSSQADRKTIEDSTWSHGAFTHCLLKAMSGEADGFQSAGPKDGIITMGEIRSYMNRIMPDETQKVIGTPMHPKIETSTGDPAIWDLSLLAK